MKRRPIELKHICRRGLDSNGKQIWAVQFYEQDKIIVLFQTTNFDNARKIRDFVLRELNAGLSLAEIKEEILVNKQSIMRAAS
jgi:hypothetical protein